MIYKAPKSQKESLLCAWV